MRIQMLTSAPGRYKVSPPQRLFMPSSRDGEVLPQFHLPAGID
jgi:hypothetical protein